MVITSALLYTPQGALVKHPINIFAEYHLLDLEEEIDLAFTKPVSVTFHGKTCPTGKWSQVFVTLCRMLYDEYPDRFQALKDDSQRIIFGEETTWELQKPIYIADNLLVEGCGNGTEHIRKLQALLRSLWIDYELVQIRYVRYAVYAIQNLDQTIPNEDEEETDPLVAYLESQLLQYVDNRDKGGFLWIIGGTGADALMQPLKNSERWNAFELENGPNGLRMGEIPDLVQDEELLGQVTYEELLRSSEQEEASKTKEGGNASVSQQTANTLTSVPNLRKEFRAWLLEGKASVAQTENYCKALETIGNFAVRFTSSGRSVFQISETVELEKTWSRVRMEPALFQLACDCERYPTAIRLYRTFLEMRKTAKKAGPKSSEASKKQSKLTEQQEPSKSTDRREAFRTWLVAQNAAPEQVNSYLTALETIGTYAMCNFGARKSAFQVGEAAELYLMWNQVKLDSNFQNADGRSLGRFLAAVRMYGRFLKEQLSEENPGKKPESEPKKEPETKSKEGTGDKPPKQKSACRHAFEEWLSTNDVRDIDAEGCADALDDLGVYLTRKKLVRRPIWSVFGVARLEKLCEVLTATEKDGEESDRVALRLRALQKYIQYRKSEASNQSNNLLHQKFMEILRDNFTSGFRLNSMIDRGRFKTYYADKYGEELNLEDDEVVDTVRKIGRVQENRAFYQDGGGGLELLDDIQEEIAIVFQNAKCVYFESVFERYQQELISKLQIYTVSALKEQLLKTSFGAYLSDDFCLYIKSDQDALADAVVFLQEHQTPQTIDQIHEALWYYPVGRLEYDLRNSDQVVNLGSKQYFFYENFPITQKELKGIENLLRRELEKKEFVTDEELRQLIDRNCPSVAIEIADYSTTEVRRILAKLLQGSFYFKNNLISATDRKLTKAKVTVDFCKERDAFKLADYKECVKSTGYDWDTLYKYMMRISFDDFVRKGTIPFNVPETDAVLDRLIEGEYASLAELDLFLQFPALPVQWNAYVLQSYVAQYSQKFRLLRGDYGVYNDCTGAVVRRQSKITSLDELITDVLAHEEGWRTSADALSLLVQKGYLKSKTYSGIERITRKALNMRTVIPKE